MKAVKSYTKEYYKQSAPSAMEFPSIESAAEYLLNKWHEHDIAYYTRSILNDTNCDAIYFDDSSVVLLDF